MKEINFKDQKTLSALVSEEFGEWTSKVLIDQDLINQYAVGSDSPALISELMFVSL